MHLQRIVSPTPSRNAAASLATAHSAMSEERFAMFRNAMPTAENFSGMLDRTPLDAAIAKKERHMAENGIASRSHATTSG